MKLCRIRNKATGKWLDLKMGIQVSWLVSRSNSKLFEQDGPSLTLKYAERILKEDGIDYELVEYKPRSRT